MSNRSRHQRRRFVTLPRHAAVDLARRSCVIRGCTCAPDIAVRHVHGMTNVSIRHDDWCPTIDKKEST